MSRTKAIIFIVMFVSASAALGQVNVCTYNFDMGTFQFCITDGGTLASMQLPGGTNLLDPGQSDGFAWYFDDGYDDYLQGEAFPYYGTGCSLSSQPGALPMIFSCHEPQGLAFDNTVTANASARTVTFTLAAKEFPCFANPSCFWAGAVMRAAAFTPVQLGNTVHSAFAWDTNAIMLTAACPNHWEYAYKITGGYFDSYSAMDMFQNNFGFWSDSLRNSSGSIAAFCQVFGRPRTTPKMKFTYRIPPAAWGF